MVSSSPSPEIVLLIQQRALRCDCMCRRNLGGYKSERKAEKPRDYAESILAVKSRVKCG